MKSLTYFSVIIVFLIDATLSQAKEYNLKELIDLSFENNPQLRANEKTILAGMKQIDYLNKDYLPQIFFDLNVSRWDWVLPNKQKLLGNSLNDIYADVRVNQLVYDWSKNSLQKEYTDKTVDIDRNFTRKLKQSLIFSIARYYLELLKAKRIVQIQEEAINQLREHLKNAESLYSIGKVSNLDVIKAQVQIEVALDELAKAKNQLDVQKNNINVLCENRLGDSFDVVDNIDDLWNQYSNKSFNNEGEVDIQLVPHNIH